jgi:STE24 endopeptidase
MATTGVPPPPNPGVAYTKRLRVAQEAHALFQFLGIILYGLSDLHSWIVATAKGLASNFYAQIILCSAPLGIIAALGLLLFSAYGYSLDRKFGLARSSLQSRLVDAAKGSVIWFCLNCAILEITFASNRYSAPFGWLWSATFCALLFLGVVSALPWLLSFFYPVAPLGDDALHERLVRLGDKAGTRFGKILEWRISARTRQANALVSGIGGARRILVTDTLLSELTPEEVEAIIAHELGHCALHHIAKRAVLRWVLFSPVFWLINASVTNSLLWFADPETGWGNLKLVPAVFLCWQVGYIYGNLIMAAMSRRQEKAADLFSWKIIGSAKPFISAMHKFTALNLIVFDKGSQWKYMHPPTPDRIAAAEQYERELAAKSAANQMAAGQSAV